MNLDVFNPFIAELADKEQLQTSIETSDDIRSSLVAKNAPMFPTVAPTSKDVSFMDTLNSQLGYAYMPMIDKASNLFQFSESDRDPAYDPFKDMEGFDFYSDYLKDAVNSEHMLTLKRQILANEERRDILANSSFGSQLVAGIFDPLNLITIPFGGFALGTFRAAVQSGGVVAGIQAIQEVGRYPFDPLATPDELGANIGMAFLGGAVIGGTVGGINKFRYNRAIRQLEESETVLRDVADDTNVNPVRQDVDESGTPNAATDEYVFHGTNLRSQGVEYIETGRFTTERDFIDTNGDLVLRGSGDQLVGDRLYGVSLADTYDGAVPYTAPQTMSGYGMRDQNLALNSNARVFQIKKSALENLNKVQEAMGETVVIGDLRVKRGDYEILRGDQRPINFDADRPFVNSSKDFLEGVRDQTPRTLGSIEKKLAKLEDDPDIYNYYGEGQVQQLYKSRENIRDIFASERKLASDFMKENKGLEKNIDVLRNYIKNIKKARDEYKSNLDSIKEDILAQSRGERGLNLGLSKKQIDFLNKIKEAETTKFFNPSQLRTLKEHIENIKKAQNKIETNKQALLNRDESSGFIREDRRTELSTRLKQLNRILRKQSFQKTLLTTRYEKTQSFNKAVAEIKNRDIDANTVLDDNGVPIKRYDLVQNWFTKSPLYKAIVTPVKTAFTSKTLTTYGKGLFHRAFSDSGMAQVAGKYGVSNGHSVATKTGVWYRLLVQTHDDLRALYSEHTGKNLTFLDYDLQKKGYKQWLTDTQKKIIKGEPLTELDAKVKTITDRFWKTWEKNLSDADMIGSTGSLLKSFQKNNSFLIDKINSLDDLINKRNRQGFFADEATRNKMANLKAEIMPIIRGEVPNVKTLTPEIMKTIEELGNIKITKLTKNAQYYKEKTLLPSIKKTVRDMEEILGSIEYAKTNRVLPANEEFFFPRFWDIAAIKNNIPAFKRILTEWYTNNPTIIVKNTDGTFKRVDALTPEELARATNPQAVAKRVDDTVNNIIRKNEDIADDSMAFYGHGKSQHMRHRTLDIPNKMVVDFIVTDPIDVMRVYTQRVAPRYEFNKMFGGKSVTDVADDLDAEALKAGASVNEMNMHRKNFLHMYDRIAGRVIRSPDRWDMNLVTILRNAAQWSYLGSAGFSTIPDAAKILLEHEIGNVMKGLIGVMKDNRIRMTAKEGRLAGEILEIFLGDVHLRNVEDLTSNALDRGFQLTASKVTNLFYLLNGLAPATNLMKKLDATIRQHELIDFAIKDANGTIKQKDLQYLRRYGIDKEDSLGIKTLVDNGTIQNTQPNGQGVYLANSEKWLESGGAEKTLDNFRGAMNNGIANTILQGTPADKPIIADGIVYVPSYIGKKFGLKEDPKFRGYARLETGLAGLPFQFWSYSFAAANKITAAVATGQAKNITAATVTALGLGWLSLQIKSEFATKAGERIWDNLSFTDQLARSFDASGLAALYTDLFYTGMNFSMALGGPDISGGLLQPKFPQKENVADAITAFGGAGPSIAVDYGRGILDILDGNYGEGSKMLLKNFPFMRLWFIKDRVNEIGNTLVDIDDEGFDRAMRARF